MHDEDEMAADRRERRAAEQWELDKQWAKDPMAKAIMGEPTEQEMDQMALASGDYFKCCHCGSVHERFNLHRVLGASYCIPCADLVLEGTFGGNDE